MIAMTKVNRKEKIKNLADEYAVDRVKWKRKNKYFHCHDQRYLSFLIPKNSKVLDLGCGIGDLLASLEPCRGVGIDFSEKTIELARKNHPEYEFIVADVEDEQVLDELDGKFDFIIMSDTIGSLVDCQQTLFQLHKLCMRETRIIISYYSYFWEPVLKLSEKLGLKMPQAEQNYLATKDIINFLKLADFDVVGCDWRQLIPLNLFGIGNFINKYIATLPIIRRFNLRNYVVARSLKHAVIECKSCSIIIPCRNEKGNIESAVQGIPQFCDDIEIIFVEGHSADGTYEEIERVIDDYAEHNIKLLQQKGKGKADATFMGFDHAQGDVLIILDGDLTVPPEQLVKFWNAVVSGKGEYINGTRLIYPMEDDAMRFLNLVANWSFSLIFTWLLNQRFTDTLCGTKVLFKSDYLRMKKEKAYFDAYDPFGDFDLLFCCSKLNLKMIEIPIYYKDRQYGNTQIQRFRNGWQLLKLVWHGYKKLKAF